MHPDILESLFLFFFCSINFSSSCVLDAVYNYSISITHAVRKLRLILYFTIIKCFSNYFDWRAVVLRWTATRYSCILPFLWHERNRWQLANIFALLSRRYKQTKEYPQELPKSPVPPPSVEEYVPTPSPECTLRSTIVLPHDHLDEIREERVHLSQVFYS